MGKYNWRKIAQLMFKVSCGLAGVVLLLTAVVTVLAFRVNDKKAEYEDLKSVTLSLSAELNQEKIKNQEAAVEEEPAEQTPPVVEDQGVVSTECLGEFKITYYCPCEKCCGEWGKNRPVVNNKKVVQTATGAFAQEGITIAVDPSKIPYGTLVYIEGVGYRVAQDCGGAIKGNRIDVYMDSHAEALKQGVRVAKVYTINQGGTENE